MATPLASQLLRLARAKATELSVVNFSWRVGCSRRGLQEALSGRSGMRLHLAERMALASGYRLVLEPVKGLIDYPVVLGDEKVGEK